MDLRLSFALEGFRILKARPKLLLFWGAVSLFGYGICFLLQVAIIGPYLADILSPDKNPDMAVVERVAEKALTAFGACAPIYLVTSTLLVCAICRAGLTDGDDRLGFLRFGLQELRVLAVQAVTLFLCLILFLAIGVTWTLFGPPKELVNLGAYLGILAAAWLRLRLSLNAAQSFATRRIDIYGSIALTRGRSIALLGGYLLTAALAIIVWNLCEAIIGGVDVLAFGPKRSDLPPNFSSLPAFLTAANITMFGLWFGLVMPQIAAITDGAPVAAYRELTGARI